MKHVVRPLCATEQVKLVEKNTTDTQRTNSAYQKTGDLITLPYTEGSVCRKPKCIKKCKCKSIPSCNIC